MAQFGHTQARRERSVFRTVIVPLLILLAVEILILLGGLWMSGIVGQLNQNAREIADKQVENRRSYLEGTMVGTWSDLRLLAQEINRATQDMLDDGSISLEQLDSSSDACAPLLLDVADEMISTPSGYPESS